MYRPEYARAGEIGLGLLLPLVLYSTLPAYRKFSSGKEHFQSPLVGKYSISERPRVGGRGGGAGVVKILKVIVCSNRGQANRASEYKTKAWEVGGRVVKK